VVVLFSVYVGVFGGGLVWGGGVGMVLGGVVKRGECVKKSSAKKIRNQIVLIGGSHAIVLGFKVVGISSKNKFQPENHRQERKIHRLSVQKVVRGTPRGKKNQGIQTYGKEPTGKGGTWKSGL